MDKQDKQLTIPSWLDFLRDWIRKAIASPMKNNNEKLKSSKKKKIIYSENGHDIINNIIN